KQCDELLRQAGIAQPASASRPLPPATPRRDLFEEARSLWAHGRLAPSADLPGVARAPLTAAVAAPPCPPPGAAASALAEQCLRGLSARDPARREQAARHLAAMPVPAAAPALASALGAE